MPLEYFNRAKERMMIHPDTKADLEMLLTLCYEQGEEAALRFIRYRYLTKEDKRKR